MVINQAEVRVSFKLTTALIMYPKVFLRMKEIGVIGMEFATETLLPKTYYVFAPYRPWTVKSRIAAETIII